MQNGWRDRRLYALWIGSVIVLGLTSRTDWADHSLHPFITAYAGDTLWALTVFLTLGFVFPKLRILPVMLLALAIAFGVEFLQLYQAPSMNALRETLPGKLLLGANFLWSDLICYSTGIALGVGGEQLALSRKRFGAGPARVGRKGRILDGIYRMRTSFARRLHSGNSK